MLPSVKEHSTGREGGLVAGNDLVERHPRMSLGFSTSPRFPWGLPLSSNRGQGDYPADPSPSFCFHHPEPISKAAQFAWDNQGGQGFQSKPGAVQTVCVMLPADVTDGLSNLLPSHAPLAMALPPLAMALPPLRVALPLLPVASPPLAVALPPPSVVKRGGAGLPVYSASWTAQQLLQNLDITTETHDIWQDMHLTCDSCLTLPDYGFAQVVTKDAGISDLMGFCELTTYSQGASTALHRSAPGNDWHVVGTTSGDLEEVELLCAADLPREGQEGQVGCPTTQGCGAGLLHSDPLPQPWVWASSEAASYVSTAQVVVPAIILPEKSPKLLWEVPLEEVVAVGGSQWQLAQSGWRSGRSASQQQRLRLIERQGIQQASLIQGELSQSADCLLAAKLRWLLQCRARLYSTQPTRVRAVACAPPPAASSTLLCQS